MDLIRFSSFCQKKSSNQNDSFLVTYQHGESIWQNKQIFREGNKLLKLDLIFIGVASLRATNSRKKINRIQNLNTVISKFPLKAIGLTLTTRPLNGIIRPHQWTYKIEATI